MSTEFYGFKADGTALTELEFLTGLPDPLRFERVKEYTLVVQPYVWLPNYRWSEVSEAERAEQAEEDVRVTCYRVFGADHNVLWAYFWRKQTELEGWEEHGVLQRFERFGGNHAREILLRLAEGFALRVTDELGFELGSEEFDRVNV